MAVNKYVDRNQCVTRKPNCHQFFFRWAYTSPKKEERDRKKEMNKIQDHVVWSSIARIPEGIKGKFGWLVGFNIPPNTLYVILGMGFYGSNDPTTVSEHWRK